MFEVNNVNNNYHVIALKLLLQFTIVKTFYN